MAGRAKAMARQPKAKAKNKALPKPKPKAVPKPKAEPKPKALSKGRGKGKRKFDESWPKHRLPGHAAIDGWVVKRPRQCSDSPIENDHGRDSDNDDDDEAGEAAETSSQTQTAGILQDRDAQAKTPPSYDAHQTGDSREQTFQQQQHVESGDFTAPAASAPTTVDEDSQPDLRLDMDKNAETSPGLEPNTDLPHASDNTKTKTDEADESCDGGLTEMLENIMDQEQLDGHDSPKATEFCPNNDTAEADADSGASGGGGGDEAWPECILMPWSQTSLHQQAAAALLDQLKFILGKDVLQKQIDSWPVQLKIGTACSGTGAAEDALFCFVDALHLDEDLKIGKDFTANISFMVEKAKFKQKFLSCVHVDCFDQAGGGGCHLFNDVTCERMQCLIHRQCDDCASD